MPLCEGITGITLESDLGPVPLQRVSYNNDSSYPRYNHRRLWVLAQDLAYDCVLTDTEYNARFFYSASEQAQCVDPEYSFTWVEDDIYGSYFYIADALATLRSVGKL